MTLEDVFPNLGASYRITSPASRTYNCIAWAAEKADAWWEPTQGYYWSPSTPSEGTVIALVQVFESLGFERCDSRELEPGWTKIAIYGQGDEYTHATRQLPNGQWTSKLGVQVDIEHASPEALVGNEYGSILGVM